jgi:hypothetical protein
MPFSAYDTHALHILTEALSFAVAEFVGLAGSPTQAQISEAERSITKQLMVEYDAGERDPKILARSAAKAVVRLRGTIAGV